MRLLFRRGMASYAIGIAVWQFDLNNCWAVQVWWPAVSGLPNPQLHAWWHVFVSLGFYHLIALAALDRLLVLGRAPRLRWWAGLPVVVDAKGRVFWELNNPVDVARIENVLQAKGWP